MSRSKSLALIAAFALALASTTAADARIGRGGSFGSRGFNTYSAPPATRTAPTRAAPIERSMTQPGAAQRAPAAGVGQAARPGMFGSSGFMGGLFAGMLGAGLLGMLFGSGFFGGLTGLGSILGLVLQLGLLFIVARLVFAWWQRRNQPAPAGMAYRNAMPATDAGPSFAIPSIGSGSRGGSGGTGYRATADQPTDAVGIAPADFDSFEAALGEIQTAYGREDLGALSKKVTPEMLSYFSDELADNLSRGVVNRVSDVKLLSGDLAESWREGGTDYATVAMRFGLRDVTEERETGRVVDTGPSEATEVWTFRRAMGGNWLLSAIQQA